MTNMQSYQLENHCTFFKLFPVLWVDVFSEGDFICENVKIQIKICQCCSVTFTFTY